MVNRLFYCVYAFSHEKLSEFCRGFWFLDALDSHILLWIEERKRSSVKVDFGTLFKRYHVAWSDTHNFAFDKISVLVLSVGIPTVYKPSIWMTRAISMKRINWLWIHFNVAVTFYDSLPQLSRHELMGGYTTTSTRIHRCLGFSTWFVVPSIWFDKTHFPFSGAGSQHYHSFD